MGIKLKPENETTCALIGHDRRTINLTHWRAIREATHKNVKGLFVIARNFRLYFIPGYTVDKFNEANYCNKTLDTPFQFIKNVLSCRFCSGDGKTDWVEAARGPSPKKRQQYGYEPDYYRCKKGPVHMITSHSPPYFVGTVVLHRGDEYCKHCRGSGLEFASQNSHNMTETIKFAYS